MRTHWSPLPQANLRTPIACHTAPSPFAWTMHVPSPFPLADTQSLKLEPYDQSLPWKYSKKLNGDIQKANWFLDTGGGGLFFSRGDVSHRQKKKRGTFMQRGSEFQERAYKGKKLNNKGKIKKRMKRGGRHQKANYLLRLHQLRFLRLTPCLPPTALTFLYHLSFHQKPSSN